MVGPGGGSTAAVDVGGGSTGLACEQASTPAAARPDNNEKVRSDVVRGVRGDIIMDPTWAEGDSDATPLQNSSTSEMRVPTSTSTTPSVGRR